LDYYLLFTIFLITGDLFCVDSLRGLDYKNKRL